MSQRDDRISRQPSAASAAAPPPPEAPEPPSRAEAEIRMIGHSLYQWVYRQVAEGVEVGTAALAAELALYGLSYRDEEEVLKRAIAEAGYRYGETPAEGPADREENLYLSAAEASSVLTGLQLERWDRESERQDREAAEAERLEADDERRLRLASAELDRRVVQLEEQLRREGLA